MKKVCWLKLISTIEFREQKVSIVKCQIRDQIKSLVLEADEVVWSFLKIELKNLVKISKKFPIKLNYLIEERCSKSNWSSNSWLIVNNRVFTMKNNLSRCRDFKFTSHRCCHVYWILELRDIEEGFGVISVVFPTVLVSDTFVRKHVLFWVLLEVLNSQGDVAVVVLYQQIDPTQLEH